MRGQVGYFPRGPAGGGRDVGALPNVGRRLGPGFPLGRFRYPIRSNTPARGGSGMDCPPCSASRRTPDDTGVAGGLRCGGRRLMKGMHLSPPGGLEVFRERYGRRVSEKWCSLRRLGMTSQGWTVARVPVPGVMASARGPSGTWRRRSWGHPPSTQHSYARVPGRAGVSNCRALIGHVCSWRGVSSGRRPN